jgi:hypothetical protein
MTEDMSAMVRRAAIDAITKARPRPAPPRSARGPRAPAPRRSQSLPALGAIFPKGRPSTLRGGSARVPRRG